MISYVISFPNISSMILYQGRQQEGQRDSIKSRDELKALRKEFS
jgi:hypothetical protein